MAKVISQLHSGGSVPKHNNLQGLNEGDYIHLTQFEKAKLDGIQSGAEVNVNADWNAISGDAQILNKPASFPPSSHSHPISEITGLQGELDARTIDTQIEISTNSNISDTWNGKTILFTANCTITVPATLLPQFGFVFRTLAGVTVTWAITAPFTWETTPTTTPEKTTGHFMRRGSTNTILLDF